MSFAPFPILAKKNETLQKRRWVSFDVIRGLAIILMVAFHIVFDVRYFFGILSFSYTSGIWFFIGKISAMLFMIVSGAVTAIKFHEQGGNIVWSRVLKRATILGALATIITIVTAIFIPSGTIYFGIIHFFAASTLLMPFFLRFPWYFLITLGVLFIILSQFLTSIAVATNLFLPFGFTKPHYFTLDYYPLLPWFSVMLFGMAIGSLLYLFQERLPPLAFYTQIKPLAWLGRHSLLIYFLHQPIILLVLQLFSPENNLFEVLQ